VAVNPVPEGYRTVNPYLVVKGATKVIDFMKAAFGAKELVRMPGPNGTIGHAEIKIGDSMVMIADANAQHPPTNTFLYLYVPDVDATYKSALRAGAKSTQEPTTQFYGDRNANVEDPAGNRWGIATHVEDVSPEEMKKRMAAMKQ
jgi:PhnB protein